MESSIPTALPPDVDRGPPLCLLTWVLFGLSTFLIAARLVSKVSVLKRFAVDDVLMVLSWVCTAVYSACVQSGIHGGLGRHFEYLNLLRVLEALRWIYTGLAFSIAAPLLGRVSFSLYLLVIIGRSKKTFRYLLWSMVLLGVAFNVALIATLYSTCGLDMTKIVDPNETCFRVSPLSRYIHFVGVLNSVTDAVLTLAPTLLISRLHTTLEAKLAASVLLGLSSLAMIASIWRTIKLGTVFSNDLDFTYDAVPYFEATSYETNVIIISASIPTLGPTFKHFGRKWRGGSPPTSTSDSGRLLSGASEELQYSISRALGMRMPGMGNSVTITAGPEAKDSQEHILSPEVALSTLPAIKTTTRTVVTTESMGWA